MGNTIVIFLTARISTEFIAAAGNTCLSISRKRKSTSLNYPEFSKKFS